MTTARFRNLRFFKRLAPKVSARGFGFIVGCALWTCASLSLAQQNDPKTFFFDVLCFKGSSEATQRIDVYALVPYSSLTFVKKGNTYIGDYLVTVSLVKDGKKIQQVTREYPLSADKAEAATGVTGAFDYAQIVLEAPPGQYAAEVSVADGLSKRVMNGQRSFTVVDFGAQAFSMSSLMFSNAIAQNGARYAVTPYLDDDVAPIASETFFVFFETYNRLSGLDSADFVCEALDLKNNRVALGKRSRRRVADERTQQYLKIELPQNLAVGSYMLRVLALKPDTTKEYAPKDVLALASRGARIEWKGLGFGVGLQGEELAKAVKQLRYATSAQNISEIQTAPNDEEKQRRFYEFWKKLDPTPGTPRNEAYDEYYARIDFANRTFRHYSEGWQTDMGMVYTIFGQPSSAREQRRIDGRMVVSWYYSYYGREFVFVDNGFGDFRLISPIPFERYRYRR